MSGVWKEDGAGQPSDASRKGEISWRRGNEDTGISRRKFRPNLQSVHVTTANGTRKTMRVCVQCIRSGAVVKRIHRTPFQLPKTATGK